MSKSSANNKLISKRPYGRFFVYTIIAYALLFDAYDSNFMASSMAPVKGDMIDVATL